MSSDATRVPNARSYGRHGSRCREKESSHSNIFSRNIFRVSLAVVVFLFALIAATLLGSALLGHAGQASTDTSFGGIPNEKRDGLKESLRQGVSRMDGAFEGRLPEQAQPEKGALGYLRLLEHLPARPPAIGTVSSPFGPRFVSHRGHRYTAQGYLQGRYLSGISNDEDFLSGRHLGREEFHSGIDIAVPQGTPVRAPGPGVVIATARSPRLGTYVRLLHEEVQMETVLAHLSLVEDDLKRGQQVRRGEVVGFSGNSGRSTGPHLHFEIRSLPGRLPVDPTEVYELYFTCLDQLSRFPIGSVHARLEPYRIWVPVGEGGGKREEGEARGGTPSG